MQPLIKLSNNRILPVVSTKASSTVNDVRRKLLMVEIHSTVEKQAKRMPETTEAR